MKENKKSLRPVARKLKPVKRSKDGPRGETAPSQPPPPPPPVEDPPRGGGRRR